MVLLHRLGHDPGRFYLNPDLVFVVEANPDTTISMTTGQKLVVEETVEEVVGAIRAWRSGVLADALGPIKLSRPFAAR